MNVNHLLAITLTAALLFVIANVTPVLAIEFGGIHTEANILTAALSLERGWIFWSALALTLTMFVVPLLQISLLLWVLSYASCARRAPAYKFALVVLHHLRPWSMSEVFLLGALVAIVKLSAWVHVVPGEGIWALGGLTIGDTRQLRRARVVAFRGVRLVRSAPTAASLGLIACRICGLVSPRLSTLSRGRCARCASAVRARAPRSAERTLAWLLAGMILYIPANLLPVMYTSGVQGGQESTILSGVISFWRAGSWDIAALIFIASVAVPATKFIALGLMLWMAQQGTARGRRERAKLYRVVEFIGYWSMLDVAVVALTSALLQFKALGTAEPRAGIVFFSGVVVTTMIAAMSFDPRLIWDGQDRDD